MRGCCFSYRQQLVQNNHQIGLIYTAYCFDLLHKYSAIKHLLVIYINLRQRDKNTMMMLYTTRQSMTPVFSARQLSKFCKIVCCWIPFTEETWWRLIWFLYARFPFELCRGTVRPSVCPSVHPCFPDFSSTCFEISIWNLVYTFSRWHDMSSSSCITIGSLWPSLQPKVGQTHFFNHGLINQDKFFKFGTQVACCILLDISSVFCKNIIFRILAIIFVRFGFFKVFRAFFLHVLRYQFETWYIHAVGGVTRQEASDFVHTLILWVS